ncbi:MAG: MBL fold metallo-hydrolase [Polyangiales bacterium]
MFSTTFLGHQGWVCSHEGSTLLIDPLLRAEFGLGSDICRVYPPREWSHDAPLRVSAVLLTHEHEDHFDVGSLCRIDRGVPVLLSALSSSAAETILRELGFSVQRVHAGDVVTVGSLRVSCFSADHVETNNSDEWDVLQFLVADTAGDGSLCSYVDAHMTPDTVAAVRARCARRGLWAVTNNTTVWPFVSAGRVTRTDPPFDTLALASEFVTTEARLRWQWEPPAGMLVTGGGFAFADKQEWLNRNVFTADSERIARAVAELLPGQAVFAPSPGTTVRMQQGSVVGVDPATPWLSAAPRASWPDRTYHGDVSLMEDYDPRCGRSDLAESELHEVLRELEDFARALYGGPTFRAICSADARRIDGRKPGFAIVLRGGGDALHTLEYDPTGCRFVRVDCDDAAAEYLYGIECWGSDLHAVLCGTMGPLGIVYGGSRIWSFAAPGAAPFTLEALWQFLHPMRRPTQTLALYRALALRHRGDPSIVRATEPRPVSLARDAP